MRSSRYCSGIRTSYVVPARILPGSSTTRPIASSLPASSSCTATYATAYGHVTGKTKARCVESPPHVGSLVFGTVDVRAAKSSKMTHTYGSILPICTECAGRSIASSTSIFR